MFNFKGVTHVIENPRGHAPGYRYSLVGSVPASMLERRPPTAADAMAGRVLADGFAYHNRPWDTIEQILTEAARAQDVTLCASSTCACRQLFDAPQDGPR